MTRREFIGITVWGASALPGYRPGAASGWKPASDAARDIRLRVLEYAVRAPNSHNAQPWRIEFVAGEGMRLYVDRSRLLPASDPLARQIHVSQGTFLELLDIAAREFGYRADCTYFPQGDDTLAGARPVAAIDLRRDGGAGADPLFAAIQARQSNKRPFASGEPVPPASIAALSASLERHGAIHQFITDSAQRAAIAAICERAMAVEISDVERNRETARWFRFSDRELRERRDGFGLEQSGVSGVKKWVAENFLLRRAGAGNPAGPFARSAVTQTRDQARSAPAFGVLVSRANTRLDQVLAGRAYARADLTAAAIGLQLQPLSQALEEYPEMAEPQRQLKQLLHVGKEHTIQMLFRLGHARATAFAPRRSVADLVQMGAGGSGLRSEK